MNTTANGNFELFVQNIKRVAAERNLSLNSIPPEIVFDLFKDFCVFMFLSGQNEENHGNN